MSEHRREARASEQPAAVSYVSAKKRATWALLGCAAVAGGGALCWSRAGASWLIWVAGGLALGLCYAVLVALPDQRRARTDPRRAERARAGGWPVTLSFVVGMSIVGPVLRSLGRELGGSVLGALLVGVGVMFLLLAWNEQPSP